MRKDLTEVENITLDKVIVKIIDSYVEAEFRYIDLVYLESDQEGMSKEELKEYILYLRELRLFQLGMLSNVEVRKNPLPWMEWLVSGTKHDNFFEKKVTDYTHGVEGEIAYDKYKKLLVDRELKIS